MTEQDKMSGQKKTRGQRNHLFLPCNDQRRLGSLIVLFQRHVETINIVGVFRNPVFFTHQEINQLQNGS